MRSLKQIYVILLLGYSFIGLAGCASLKEGAKCIAGTSTRDIERSRAGAIVKSFNYDYGSCYSKTEEILKSIGAYVYAKNKGMIAVYVSEEDTTPVGLFFKETDASSTQIEVSSPSTYAKELISAKVFSALEGEPNPEEGQPK